MTPMFFIVCIAVLGICAYVWYIYQSKGLQELQGLQESQPILLQPQVIQVEQDDRYMRAPKPERHWITRPDIPNAEEIYGKLPRVPTRGIPETYQSMGIIKTDDGQILPLYGRRTTARSDRFQYYTRTDTYNPVQLPIRYNRRDCQDDIGCEELGDRDVVTITPTNQRGTATIYRFDGPTYVPGIV
ncbi:MAG: hypothetical protein EBU66_06925 [Bacteroidetes bacterium]|nr:hypothetical protein [bacterium]NBP64394.1 hypothetical protein [Bacteroidota bacterium]